MKFSAATVFQAVAVLLASSVVQPAPAPVPVPDPSQMDAMAADFPNVACYAACRVQWATAENKCSQKSGLQQALCKTAASTALIACNSRC